MTITLEEALKRAASGPLKVGRGFRLEQNLGGGRQGIIVADVTHDSHEDEGSQRNKYTSAVMAHSYNTLPKLVEALKDTVERLESWWEAAGCPAHETEIHLAEAKELLKEANTVTLP